MPPQNNTGNDFMGALVKASQSPSAIDAAKTGYQLSGLSGNAITPSYWQAVKDVVEHPIHNAIPLLGRSLYNQNIAPSVREWKEAAHLAKGPSTLGNLSEVAGHALAGSIPWLGPAAANVGEPLGMRQPSKAIVPAVELGAMLAGPKLYGEWKGFTSPASREARGMKAIGGALGVPWQPEATEIPPASDLPASVREQLEGARSLQKAKADLSQMTRESPIAGKNASSTFKRASAAYNRAADIWEQGHEPQIARHPNLNTDTKAIMDAGMSKLPNDTSVTDPAEVEKARKWLSEVVNKPRTLSQLDDFQREINDDLRKKPPEAYGPVEQRVRRAVAHASRQQLSKLLQESGEEGLTGVNTRYHALHDIGNRLTAAGVRDATMEATQPGLVGRVASAIRPHLGLYGTPGDFHAYGGLSPRPSGLLNPTWAGKLEKGMTLLGKAGLEPPPMPEAPPTRAIAGLLPKPAIELGPIPGQESESYVRGVNAAMPYREGRALPPPSFTPEGGYVLGRSEGGYPQGVHGVGIPSIFSRPVVLPDYGEIEGNYGTHGAGESPEAGARLAREKAAAITYKRGGKPIAATQDRIDVTPQRPGEDVIIEGPGGLTQRIPFEPTTVSTRRLRAINPRRFK